VTSPHPPTAAIDWFQSASTTGVRFWFGLCGGGLTGCFLLIWGGSGVEVCGGVYAYFPTVGAGIIYHSVRWILGLGYVSGVQ